MLDQFLHEFKHNLRLRIGLALILAVIWLYLILVMRDALDDSTRMHRNASNRLSQLQSVMQQNDWNERLIAATTLQASLESELWPGDTLGLSRATFQDWLNQQMQSASISHPIISMAASETSDQAVSPQADELWQVRAKVVFDFNPASLNQLLQQMMQYRHHVVIESLHITKEPVPRVEIMASAFFQKSDALLSP